MKKLITLTLLSFLISYGAAAQTNLSEEKVNQLVQLKNDIDGTYQIQMIDTRALPSIELSIFQIIADKRDQQEIVYHQVSPNMRIKILPFNEIEKSNFVPLEYYTHISSNKIK